MSEPAGPGSSESAHPTARLGEGSRLLLARHGQTDHNRAGRMQGQIDIPLNAVGLGQARALARSLEASPPDVIVASPLQRAYVTATTVGERLGLRVTTDEGLLERGFGQWEGLTGDEIRRGWPEEYEAWRERRNVAGVGMETRTEVARRVGAACRHHLGSHDGDTVLIVAHGAAITLGICDLLDLDPEGSRAISGLENCHRSVLDPLYGDPDGRLMRLMSHNLPPDFTR